MKRFKYWVVLILILSLFLCGYTSRGSSMVVQEVKENYDSSYNSYNTIRLENEYLTLPCKFRLLKGLGYVLKSRDSELVLKPMTFYTMLYAYNEQGDKVVIDVVNNTDKEQKVEDCDIYELSVEVNKDNTTSINIDLQNINFFSKVKDAENVLGKDYYLSDSYDNVQTAAWNTEKYDRDIMLTYEKGTGLIAIKVSVELPEGVEYSSASPVNNEEIDYSIPTEIEMEGNKTSYSIGSILVAVIVIGIILLVLMVGITTLIDNDSISTYHKQRKEDEKNESLNSELDIPETSYLEEKYKDYL